MEVVPEGTDFASLMAEANTSISVGEYRQAFVAAIQAQELAQTPQDRIKAAATKATTMWKLGLPRESASELLDLLEHPDMSPARLAAIYYHLATTYHSLNNLQVAETFAKRGLEFIEEGLNTPEYAGLQAMLATIASDRAEKAKEGKAALCREAIRGYEIAVNVLVQCGMPGQAAGVLSDIGVVHRISKDYELAIETLKRGLHGCREHSNQRGYAHSLSELGLAYQASGNQAQATKHFQRALKISTDLGYRDIEFQCLVRLIEARHDAGQEAIKQVYRAQILLPQLEEMLPEKARFEVMLSNLGTGGTI